MKRGRRTPADPAPTPAFILSGVDEPRPGLMLQPGAELTGKGWAVSEAEIASIGVYLGESFLCYASYGQPRPDVGRDYSHYPQANHSGFVFAVRLGPEIEQDRGADLQVRIRTRTGSEARRVVKLTWPAARIATEADAASTRAWPIRLALEECRIDGAGRLRLRGWAIARAGLTALELFLGDTPLDAPERGLPRPDIAARHPGYPDAALCGFALVQSLAAQPAAHDAVRVIGRAGRVQRQIIVPLASRENGRRLLHAGEVTLCCDTLRLAADGQLAIAGWAAGPAETREIEVLAAGVSLGFAEIGLARPDIGNRFPQWPGARFAGFRFGRPTDLARGDRLSVMVRDTAGEQRELDLLLPGGHGPEAEPDAIHAGIDTPAISGGRAAITVRGVLTIAGWAVSGRGVDHVRVWCNETLLGDAHLGGRREDIGAAYPDLPDALTAGWAISVPQRRIGPGEHAIRVVISAQGGGATEREFRILLPEEDDATLFTPRRIVPFAETALRRDGLARVGPMPEFSVVIRPAANGGMRNLGTTLDSLHRQTLGGWRAILLVPDEDEASVQALLEQDAEARARVQHRRPDDQAGLWHGPGRNRFEWLMVLRAGDRLGADALMELSVEARLAGADFVYADERCHDQGRDGVYPFLKPGWSPDLLTSTNYLGRAWCASRALVRRAGLDLRMITRGGQYNAALMLTEQARAIAHVPACLLERTGRRIDSPRREQAALEAAAARRTMIATVEPGRAPGVWRLRRAIVATPTVSVIIPTSGARALIRGAIATLRGRTDWSAIEIICLDGIPPEHAALKTWLRGAADVVIAAEGPFNWSRLNNVGAAAARGSFLLFLNDDTEARDPGWLAAMIEQAQRPKIGVVGPQLLYPDGKVQHAGMMLRGAEGVHAFRFADADDPGPFGLALAEREVAAVTGACMLMRRDVFDTLGGFDERHGVIKNDLDFCLRASAAGLRVVYTPHAQLIHHEMASRAHLPDSHDAAAFDRAWGLAALRGDRLVNPHLSTEVEDCLPEQEPVELLSPGNPLIDGDRVRRILVVKLDHIGDFVCALPALARLKAAFPGAAITLLAGAATASLAASCPLVDAVERFDFFGAKPIHGHLPVTEADYQRLTARLRPRHFDLAIDLRTHGDTRHILRRTGAAALAGFDRQNRYPWLDIAVEWDGDPMLADKRTHMAETLLRLADAVANAATAPAQALSSDPARGRATLRRLLDAAGAPPGFLDRAVVGIHPGAGNAMKQWPTAEYAGLIALLLASHDVSVVLIGAGEEVAIAAELATLAGRPDAVRSVAGQLDLSDLPGLLSACALFIGNDSGPKHLAAALGVPTVGVHGDQVDAAEWGPLGPRAIAVRRRMTCGPCYIEVETDCPRGLACIRGIRPNEVYRACRLLLGLTLGAGASVPAASMVTGSRRGTSPASGDGAGAAAA